MTSDRLERILTQTEVIGKEQLDKIEIVECGERLVDITQSIPDVILRMSKRRLEFAGGAILFARETVARMLGQVARTLSPQYRLVVYDAYRPISYQRERYEQVYADIRQRHPQEPEERLRALAFQVVFPPDEDPSTPPPHSTGGAVDVTIVMADGTDVDMGSRYGFYEDDDENERHKTNATAISPIHRQNRLILVRAMVETGFCNYPGEWWHFMYGDREYAAYEGLGTAIYGRADLLANGL